MNIRKIIREEINDWDWLEDVPAQNPTELRNYKLIRQAFEGSEFNIELGVVIRSNYALINDKDGSNYTVLRLNGDSWDWAQQLRHDIREAENICGEDCELTQKFKEIYRIFNEYFFPKQRKMNENQHVQKHTTCSRFRNEDEISVCNNIHSLRSWLHKDNGLGLRRIIDNKLRNLIEYKDLNDEYQEPLGYLYSTGKYPSIQKTDNGKYYLERLTNVGRVLDLEGNWDFVNKLNTNYGDLAELLTQLFINAGIIDRIKNKNQIGLRTYLLSIKDRISEFLDTYISPNEYFDFTKNTRVNSETGEMAENDVRDVLDLYGLKTVYQGGNGDFIDMIFGADLILVYKNRYFTVQVKNTHNLAKEALESKRYNNIDYFASPTDNGIVIINQKGEETFIDKEGKVLPK